MDSEQRTKAIRGNWCFSEKAGQSLPSGIFIGYLHHNRMLPGGISFHNIFYEKIFAWDIYRIFTPQQNVTRGDIFSQCCPWEKILITYNWRGMVKKGHSYNIYFKFRTQYNWPFKYLKYLKTTNCWFLLLRTYNHQQRCWTNLTLFIFWRRSLWKE